MQNKPIPTPSFFFDGDCALCQSSVFFLLKRTEQLHFFPLQSPKNLAFIETKEGKIKLFKTSYFWNGQHLHKGSSAVLEAIKLCPNPWKQLSLLLFCPIFLRDPVYYFIAKTRKLWFPKKNCRLPTPTEAQRIHFD